MKNWTDLHHEFTDQLAQEWTTNGFTYWQVKEWIDIGLTPYDANFVKWLEKEGYTALAILNYEDLTQLRTDYQQSLTIPKLPFNFPTKPNWKVIASLILSTIIFLVFIS